MDKKKTVCYKFERAWLCDAANDNAHEEAARRDAHRCVRVRTARPRAIEFREGGVEFNVYAPGAKTVRGLGHRGHALGRGAPPAEQIGDGWWRALIKDVPPGIQFTYYFIDGVNTLYKYAPVCYAHSFVCNFVEVPDENMDFYDYKEDVPHGRCAASSI